ncbi:MAG TPA: HD domain-containing protein [Kofleriaceae bacterium]|nr:HD domain-containing protein [Kofleriaceae bacterium]
MELQELLEDRNDAGMAIRALIQEAPLTILRIAIAISENRGRWPAESVTRAAGEESGLILDLPAVEVRQELERCLLGRDVDQALEWLHAVGVVKLLLPELEDCVDLAQEAGRMHKDVWDHTKLVVKQSVRRPAVRWAALLHDIGKVPTRTFTKNGVHFHGHAEVGARMFDKVARRLPFEHDDRKKIRFLIKHHLRSNQYGDKWTDSAVRRFARDMEPHLTDLLDLSRADITSKRPGRRQMLLHRISELADRIERLREEDARLPPLPPGLGNTIMSHFGLQPSRLIGDLKRALEVAIESGEVEARRDDAYYIDWLEKSGLINR